MPCQPCSLDLFVGEKKNHLPFFNFFYQPDHVPRDKYREPTTESKTNRTEREEEKKGDFGILELLDLFLLFLATTKQSVPLLRDSCLSPLSGRLGLCTLGVHLFLEDTLAGFLGFRLVNVLNQGPPVLKGVTLAQMVQLVVQMLIDLPGSTVLDEEATKHTKTAHPEYLAGHTRVLGTLPLTEAGVTTSTFGIGQNSGTRARVHGCRLLDDEAVPDELADGLA